MNWSKIKSSVAGSTVNKRFHEDFDEWCQSVGGETEIRDGKYEDELHCHTDMGDVSIVKNPSAWTVSTPDSTESVSGVPYWRTEDGEFHVRGHAPRNNTVKKVIELEEDITLQTDFNKKPDPRRHS